MKQFKKLSLLAAVAVLVAACSVGSFEFYPASYEAAPELLPPEESESGDTFDGIVENGFVKVSEQPVSTFSIDADGASWAYARRCISNSNWPSMNAIRVEEFLNYFTFNYPSPSGDETLAINAEISECPWNTEHKLLRLGLKGKDVTDSEMPPANFIFLIDTSGSMYGEDRIDLLKSGLCNMVDQLRPDDRVAIITYSGKVSMALESTLAINSERIKKVIRGLVASGSTAGGEAMKMAYEEAAEHYVKGGNNRIIMCTDGDFNVGVSSTEALVEMVESYLDKGIYLSIMGFGTGNYQDSRMENLSNHGNGTYTYIDCEDEMMKVFVHERSRFLSVANDTKCQIRFFDYVDSYRLIGYENRVMSTEDFENDKKDAGEIGAGQTITALYEIIPSEGNYTQNATAASFEVRYKKELGEESRQLQMEIGKDYGLVTPSTEFFFAAGLASYAMLLRDSKYKGNATYELARSLIERGSGAYVKDPLGLRRQAAELVGKAMKMQKDYN